LWGKEQGLVQKHYLFRVESGFYTPETRELLRHVSQRALDSQSIQDNFLQFLRILGYGMTSTLGVVVHQDLLRLAADREIVGMAWKAATARELQPRTSGSLNQNRRILAEVAGTDEHLPLPEWWTIEAPTEDAAEVQAMVAPGRDAERVDGGTGEPGERGAHIPPVV
jgi:hypothetical protein